MSYDSKEEEESTLGIQQLPGTPRFIKGVSAFGAHLWTVSDVHLCTPLTLLSH